MKHPVIAMRLHSGKPIMLPEGCIGLLFCFENKKAACAYWGKDTALIEVKVEVLKDAKSK